uniref:Putative secreted protein n=1 Tax=Amblyomma triste TaxID=251400 RepID=A0A023G4L0_AMBTT
MPCVICFLVSKQTRAMCYTALMFFVECCFNSCEMMKNERPPHQYYYLDGFGSSLTSVLFCIDKSPMVVIQKVQKHGLQLCFGEVLTKKRNMFKSCWCELTEKKKYSLIFCTFVAVQTEVAFRSSHGAVI